MGSSAAPSTPRPYLLLVLCCLLFAGVGRLASFTLHEPLLAYGNSYDMIRIQACHQIWPADKGVDITTGTPDAPLRRYTLDKTVATPCFPSSELVFTSMAIELAKIRNQLTGEPLVSIKMIAAVKATVLAVTVIGFGVFFLLRRNRYAFCLNALCMLLVLSDPAITLYLGTFYTEFSAVYFLYVLLAGVAVLAMQQYRWQAAWPLLLGIAGLGLSKPQHIPLALLAGTLLVVYLVLRPRRVGLAVLVLAVAVLPLLLLLTDHFTPRDNNMAMANKLNLVSSLLTVSDNPSQTLQALRLPADCQTIAGKEWTVFASGQESLCPAFARFTLRDVAAAAWQRPGDYLALIGEALPIAKHWIIKVYGHVEGGKMQFVYDEHFTLTQWFPLISSGVFMALFIGSSLLALAGAVCASAMHARVVSCLLPLERSLFALLLALLMWAVFLVALLGDGLFDIGKHSHLMVPLLIMTLLGLMLLPMPVTEGDAL